MNKKLFLTSMLVLGVTGPVFAEPANTSNSFPGDGLMQEDYTYVGQANSTNMAGVYNDGANGDADIIIVMQDGRIIEQGTHDELLALKGKYYELFTGNKII